MRTQNSGSKRRNICIWPKHKNMGAILAQRYTKERLCKHRPSAACTVCMNMCVCVCVCVCACVCFWKKKNAHVGITVAVLSGAFHAMRHVLLEVNTWRADRCCDWFCRCCVVTYLAGDGCTAPVEGCSQVVRPEGTKSSLGPFPPTWNRSRSGLRTSFWTVRKR